MLIRNAGQFTWNEFVVAREKYFQQLSDNLPDGFIVKNMRITRTNTK